MSYPVQDKPTRALVKAGWKRIIGLASGWAAHQAKKCMQTCFYCKAARMPQQVYTIHPFAGRNRHERRKEAKIARGLQ